tara:strand:+ start:163 stop:327 length:165 start_codon:yes stop_codon:yes gene_type:complete
LQDRIAFVTKAGTDISWAGAMAVVNHEAHLVVSALLADVAHQFDDKIVFLASDM